MFQPKLAAGMLFVVALMLVTFDVYGGVLWASAKVGAVVGRFGAAVVR